MGERPTLIGRKLRRGETILMGAGLLYFVDSVIPWWQHACGSFLTIRVCFDYSAWGGDARLLGAASGILAVLLVIWVVFDVGGMPIDVGVPRSTVTVGLAGATVLLGLLKVLVILPSDSFVGAWLGVVLLLALGYGALLTWLEPKEPAPP